jgi:DMSO reductase anchor subunit
MHPAYSVIVFTTASGAGYGLLVWMALDALFTNGPDRSWFGFVGLGLALTLISVGLLSSTLHLGRPTRAWRALSQWRTSWLSREGVLAVATYLPAGLMGLVWVFMPEWSMLLALFALPTIPLALATVWCTGMIYQSLPTIRAWNRPLVAPLYIMLALTTGGVLIYGLQLLFGRPASTMGWVTLGLLAVTAILKVVYWLDIDRAEKTWTAGAATGLGRFGKVRVLDQPHSRANYVMREMGFEVGRKHAMQLRKMVLMIGFVAPFLALAISLFSGPGIGFALAVMAVVGVGVGVVCERWLFFAEAQHVVTVYYGADAA